MILHRLIAAIGIAAAFNALLVVALAAAVTMGKLPRKSVYLWAPVATSSWLLAGMISAEPPLAQLLAWPALAFGIGALATLIFTRLLPHP